ncbi:MAG: energy-coupling factor ABC transporter substrate-binding protein [Peptococcaceae bacterium]|nr:energy-coupling factor ABC transporter substrate-binding protein [Peptococcaceae bacterium]
MGVRAKNAVMIIAVVLLAVIPLIVHPGAEFGGADGAAEEAVAEMQPDYQPWFKSVWEPPSGEIESLLFALQAAAGAGFIGYYLGLVKGRKEQAPPRR